MKGKLFLLLNLALSFYLVGAIWAVEVDIFRSWKVIDPKDFPLALALMGSVMLIWYHPGNSPSWAIWEI